MSKEGAPVHPAGTLYLVATPIGNMSDLSARAVETLKRVDRIAAEDTRRSKILLDRWEIKTPLESYHDHSGEKKREALLSMLQEGKSIALVSDSGSPLISDPGYRLVVSAIARGIGTTSVPGPSAVLAALTLSGFPTDRFIFEGFLPPKSLARKKRLTEIMEETRTVVYFESPYRLLRSLEDIDFILPERMLCAAKELTKKFEELFRGTARELHALLSKRSLKGEYVIVIRGKDRP